MIQDTAMRHSPQNPAHGPQPSTQSLEYGPWNTIPQELAYGTWPTGMPVSRVERESAWGRVPAGDLGANF